MLLRFFTVSFLLSSCCFHPAVANELTKQAFHSATRTEQQTQHAVSAYRDAQDGLTLSSQSDRFPAQNPLDRELTDATPKQLDTKQALFNAVSTALNNPSDRGMLLADLLHHHSHTITLADLTDTFYQFAAQNNPQAEQSYHQFLQQRFDELRAKQLADIAQLNEQAIQKEKSHPVQPPLAIQADSAKKKSATVDLIDISLLGMVLLLLLSVIVVFKTRQRHLKAAAASDQISPLVLQNEQLKALIRQLKYKFEKLFKEYNKLKLQQEQQELAVACAVFGYSPEQIPNQTAIKRRFRQLSKIYHPDSGGSDQEMKRLNQALKIISQRHAP